MEPTRPRVLMIGLDAAEPALIERWADDGSLPHLAGLRERGTYGRLASSARWLVGSPWPTFYTGTTPGDHGFYHYLAWSAEKMAAVRPNPTTHPLTPFWRGLTAQGTRCVTLDIPLVFHDEPFADVEVNGWATHEVLVPPASHPPGLFKQIVKRFGPPPIEAEHYALEPVGELLRMRDEMNVASAKVGELGAWMMQAHGWDLCMVGLASTHRGGHKLWDDTGVAGEMSAAERAEHADALRQVYIGCDRAIGELTAAAERDGGPVTVIAFSLHGMGHNTCRTELMGEMLGRVLGQRPVPDESDATTRCTDGSPGLSDRLRGLIPASWRHAVKSRLPLSLQDKLTAFWRLKRTDFSTTEAFALPADLQGYIRVNLAGRESAGIVEPGEPLRALRDRIERGLRSFVDPETGESVVESIAWTADLYPDGGSRDLLPDLLVRWSERPVAGTARLRSPAFGAIDWPTPGKNVTGRSGNHRPEGFMVASGPGFGSGRTLPTADILDLAPTVCDLLGRDTPWPMRGRSLCEPALAAVSAGGV